MDNELIIKSLICFIACGSREGGGGGPEREGNLEFEVDKFCKSRNVITLESGEKIVGEVEVDVDEEEEERGEEEELFDNSEFDIIKKKLLIIIERE